MTSGDTMRSMLLLLAALASGLAFAETPLPSYEDELSRVAERQIQRLMELGDTEGGPGVVQCVGERRATGNRLADAPSELREQPAVARMCGLFERALVARVAGEQHRHDVEVCRDLVPQVGPFSFGPLHRSGHPLGGITMPQGPPYNPGRSRDQPDQDKPGGKTPAAAVSKPDIQQPEKPDAQQYGSPSENKVQPGLPPDQLAADFLQLMCKRR